jgi:UDP:flavonoid glycosyltransferase YjiC (YdhE family)
VARIVLASAGTLGDHVPFVRLGKRLRARGHSVCMAFNPAMIPLAHEADLESAPCGAPFGAKDLRRIASAFDYWNPIKDEDLETQWAAFNINESTYRDLAAACRRADLLICSSHLQMGMMVQEKCSVPLVTVCLSPLEMRDRQNVPVAMAAEDERRTAKWMVYLNHVRTRLGFSPLTFSEWARSQLSKRLILVACSSLFSQPILKDCAQGHLTGFWFGEFPEGSWTPSPELTDFINVRPRPLVLALGSLPVGDAAHVVTVHAEAAAQLNRRLLIQEGWADLGPECVHDVALSRQIYFLGSAPHSWLFSKAAAVIHHGGIGTTAEAMRCGSPMVIEPYGHDQFFNAQRVVALGLGAAMNPHKLTADGLARVLVENVLGSATECRALAISAELKQEDGLSIACDLIEQQLAVSRRLHSNASDADEPYSSF